MLPAAGVAKLRDVTKSTFDKHVDDENRLGAETVSIRPVNTRIGLGIRMCQHPCVSCLSSEKFILRSLIDMFLFDRELGRRR